MPSIILILGIIAIVHFTLMFGVSRLVIPHLKWVPTPKEIPKDLEKIIVELKKKHPNQKDFLQEAYSMVTDRFIGKTMGEYRYLNRTLTTDIHKIWNTTGVQSCTTQNFVLRTVLVKSGLFKESNVKNVHSIYGLNIHQFLRIKVGDEWIWADPWGRHNNIPLGQYGGWRVTAKIKEAASKILKAS